MAVCSWQTSVASSNITLGVPRGGQQEGHPQKDRDKTCCGEKLPSHTSTHPRAGLTKSFLCHFSKAPTKKCPIKGTPPKPLITLIGLGHRAQSKQRQLFTVTVHYRLKASQCKDVIRHLPLKSQLRNKTK